MMETTSGQPSLAGRTLAMALSGIVCLVAIGALTFWSERAGVWLETWLGLTAAAICGFFARGLRRKAWFGSRLSIHQSISFEAIVQTVQWLSPALSSRAFEAEFLGRETGMGRADVSGWLQSRRLALPAIACAAAAAIWWTLGSKPVATIFFVLTVLAVLAGAWRFRPTLTRPNSRRAHVRATLAGLGAWGLEGTLFVLATQPLLEASQSLLLYVGFTAAVEAAVVPMAVGVAELPALLAIGWGAGTAGLGVLILFHGARLAILMLLGMIYLPRYKLTIDDLLDTGLIERMALSQRPPSGWDFEDDGAASCELSVVIPAYNEAERLPPYLEEVVATLGRGTNDWEVLVVDDGSTDRTRSLVRNFARAEPAVRLVCNETNLGKGGAVSRGISEARGRYILFADADGATPAAEISKLIAALSSGAEIAIGSRRLTDRAVTLRRDSVRAALGSSFYALVNFFAVPGIRDTQCGFKAFRRDAAARLFDRLSETGWAFDVEVLYRAQLIGYAIAEVPVNWQEKEGSKVDPVRDAIRMARAIFEIRRRNAGFLRRVAGRHAIPLPDKPRSDRLEWVS